MPIADDWKRVRMDGVMRFHRLADDTFKRWDEAGQARWDALKSVYPIYLSFYRVIFCYFRHHFDGSGWGARDGVHGRPSGGPGRARGTGRTGSRAGPFWLFRTFYHTG